MPKYMITGTKKDLGKLLCPDLRTMGYNPECVHPMNAIDWNKTNQPKVIQFGDLDNTVLGLYKRLTQDNPLANFVCLTGDPEDKEKAKKRNIHYINICCVDWETQLKAYASRMINKRD